MWWYIFVNPATQEAEERGSLEPIGVSYDGAAALRPWQQSEKLSQKNKNKNNESSLLLV